MSDVNLKDQRIDRDSIRDRDKIINSTNEAKICSLIISHTDPKDSYLVDENLEHREVICLIKDFH